MTGCCLGTLLPTGTAAVGALDENQCVESGLCTQSRSCAGSIMEGRASKRSCYVTGTWGGHFQFHEMKWVDGEYIFHVWLAKQEQMHFQLFFDGSRECCLYPSRQAASPYEHHEVLGPGTAGLEQTWLLDAGAEDGKYTIRVVCPYQKPIGVGWERHTLIDVTEKAEGGTCTCHMQSSEYSCGVHSTETKDADISAPDGCKALNTEEISGASKEYTGKGTGEAASSWLPSNMPKVVTQASTADLLGNRASQQSPATWSGKLPPGAKIGNWVVVRVLGKGFQGSHVYLAQWPGLGVNGMAAVKFPVPQSEVEKVLRVHDLPGVPDVLDFGEFHGNSFFASPVHSPSLDEILNECDHDGLGGRINWPAAKALGRVLVTALQGLHSRGLVHCDIKPGNVMAGANGDPQPHLIDFGLSQGLGCAALESTIGTLDYNSIRAGFIHERTPADDLESVGWLMVRCVLGHLPWRRRPHEAKWMLLSATNKVKRTESKAREKLRFIQDGPSVFGWRYDFCPPELMTYLCRTRALSNNPETSIDYEELLALLSGDMVSWSSMLMTREFHAVEAVAGRLVWRLPETSGTSETEKTERIALGLRIRLSCAAHKHDDAGHWAEVDPVWVPCVPDFLLRPCWLLMASFEEQFLKPVDFDNFKAVYFDEFFLMGSWDAWEDYAPMAPMTAGSSHVRALVKVRNAPGVEEFLVVQDKNRNQCFHPALDSQGIAGPSEALCCGQQPPPWEVHIPGACKWLAVSWNPLSGRTVNWEFLNSSGHEIRQTDFVFDPPTSAKFFLIGSWDNWEDFIELTPGSTTSSTLHATINLREVPVQQVIEFQVIQDRNWDLRYYPARDRTSVMGPNSKSGTNWEVWLPPRCMKVCVSWDPRGHKDIRWKLVGPFGDQYKAPGDDDACNPLRERYFAAGSWDGWSSFTPFTPSGSGSTLLQAYVHVQDLVGPLEFQVFQNKDWKLRYYPDEDGTTIGPSPTNGENWKVNVSSDCCWFTIT